MTPRPTYAALLRAADELRRDGEDHHTIRAALVRAYPAAPLAHVVKAADGARRPR